MVATTQAEIKRLLSKQYIGSITKSITSLVLASGLTIGIPLYYRSVKNPVDFVVNGLGFVTSSLLSIYAYINSYSIKEYGGKYKMFSELEKERFIREQLINQERYLEQINQQYQYENIDPSIYPHIVPVDNPLTTVDGAITVNEKDLSVDKAVDCPECHSINVNKNGTIEGKQKYKCKDCNYSFIEG